MTTPLRALEARLETATGADRALDSEIALTATPDDWIRTDDSKNESSGYSFMRTKSPAGRMFKSVPPYTASLDAITGLIEKALPGYAIQVTFNPALPWAVVHLNPAMDVLDIHELMKLSASGEAKAPALALCLALVRAFQSAAKETSADQLCSDCPPVDYPTDKTRCAPCPRALQAGEARGEQE